VVQWFSGPNGQVDGSMVLESPRDSDRVSVVRGIDEALQAKLDRRREEFKGTWHSQVIDEEQAEATTVDVVVLIYREGVWYES
jgi:hypothetical protein